MKLIDEGKVSHLGTLNGNCVSTAAAISTIGYLSVNNGAAYKTMERLFGELAQGIRQLFAKHGFRVVVNQLGPVMHVMFIDQDEVTDFATFNLRDSALYAQFAALMLEEGVLLRPNGLWYISIAHNTAHIEHTLTAVDLALTKLALESR